MTGRKVGRGRSSMCGSGIALSRPVGLDFHVEAGFDFFDFFPLLNPSEIFRDVIIWFYSIYYLDTTHRSGITFRSVTK